MNKASSWIAVVIILVFSLTTIWSAAPKLILNQIVFLLLSVLVTLIIARVDKNFLKSLSFFGYFLSIFLLLLTFALGTITRGTISWIEIGSFRLQPSEIVKPLLVLFLARTLDQNQPDWQILLKALVFSFPILLLIFLQPDLGAVIIMSFIILGMLFSSKIKLRYLIVILILGFLSLPLAPYFLKDYQLERLTSFVNPYTDPKGSGYNVIQAMIAVGSGSLMGKGVKQGTQSQLNFLPEKHTDFALAAFSEEFGFVGSTILMTAYLVIFLNLLKDIQKNQSFFRLVISGLFWYIFSQYLINTGMNLGILPVAGVTLPLFSYGGSSLLSLAVSIGILISISKKGSYSA